MFNPENNTESLSELAKRAVRALALMATLSVATLGAPKEANANDSFDNGNVIESSIESHTEIFKEFRFGDYEMQFLSSGVEDALKSQNIEMHIDKGTFTLHNEKKQTGAFVLENNELKANPEHDSDYNSVDIRFDVGSKATLIQVSTEEFEIEGGTVEEITFKSHNEDGTTDTLKVLDGKIMNLNTASK